MARKTTFEETSERPAEPFKKSYSMKELRDLQGREAPEESERSEPPEKAKLESEKAQDKPETGKGVDEY